MSGVIIRKKDLDKMGKKLMKEVYENFRDDYMLKFDEVKLERDYFDKNLVTKFLEMNKKKEKEYEDLYFGDKRYEEIVKMPHEDLLKKIEDEIKNETLDVEIIYKVLDGLKLNPDLNEDIYYFKRAFITIYNVYHYHYMYLED